jgi:hypothetical protein
VSKGWGVLSRSADGMMTATSTDNDTVCAMLSGTADLSENGVTSLLCMQDSSVLPSGRMPLTAPSRVEMEEK